jgi:Ca2+-binding RTX toxin-like protein
MSRRTTSGPLVLLLVGGVLLAAPTPAYAERCTHKGTGGDDVIRGSSRADVICAGPGNDSIYGLGGDDVIYSGPGTDTALGGEGNDEMYGGPAEDTLGGGPGDDLIYGGWRADTIRGWLGSDAIIGGPGDDRLAGNEGEDYVAGSNGADVLWGFHFDVHEDDQADVLDMVDDTVGNDSGFAGIESDAVEEDICFVDQSASDPTMQDAFESCEPLANPV